MIEILCECGNTLSINSVIQHGSSVRVLVEVCERCVDGKCFDPQMCDHFKELEDEITVKMIQQDVDIQGNDEMIQKIREVSEKHGGLFEKEINKILEGEEV